ncbi:MAG TPA: hypothetical protein VF054_10885 [Micromonosporaceae bacterium]
MTDSREPGRESAVLIRQVDGHLARLRARLVGCDLALAERIADTLRRLVHETAQASAADRARVRAAVHFFVVRRDMRLDRRPHRPLTVDAHVVNEILHDLLRDDLMVPLTAPAPAAAVPVAPAAVAPSAPEPAPVREPVLVAA